jgi:hypothetical protein
MKESNVWTYKLKKYLSPHSNHNSHYGCQQIAQHNYTQGNYTNKPVSETCQLIFRALRRGAKCTFCYFQFSVLLRDRIMAEQQLKDDKKWRNVELLSNSGWESVVGCNLFCLPPGKGSRHPIRISYMSDNQFILQSAKIESKLKVGKKKE